MKRKKVLAMVTVFAIMCGLLTGCGSSESDSTSGSISDSTSDAGDSSSVTTITICTWNEPSQDDDLNMYLQCEEATGINIEVTVIPESDYSSKLNQMLSTNDDSIDIYILWENDLPVFVEAGGILTLDDYLADSDIDTDDFIDSVAELSDGLGGTYGLPWCVATEILYYNQDMFDAAGLDYPTNDWSYDDFLAAAEALTQTDEDGTTVYGCTLPNTQTWWAGIGMAGDQIYDASSGEMVIGDGAISFVQDCADMVSNGIMPEPSSDTADLFASGRAAMAWAGSWNMATYGDDLDFNWDIATLPTNVVKYNTLHTGFYTINAQSSKADAAWTVIEWLMGEEGQTINSQASGNMSALMTIAEEGAWKPSSVTTVENWDAMMDSLESGVFGYTCLPSGVTSNAVSNFESAVTGELTAEEAVQRSMEYAAETIGY